MTRNNLLTAIELGLITKDAATPAFKSTRDSAIRAISENCKTYLEKTKKNLKTIRVINQDAICLECKEHCFPLYFRNTETGKTTNDPYSSCCGATIWMP